MKAKHAGFSLVETLVASLILFSVLTSALVAFQNAIMSSARAESRIDLFAKVPLIQTEVSRRFRNARETSGEGSMMRVRYAWTATLLSQGTPPQVLSEDSTQSERVFELWEVSVDLEAKNASRQFQFTELVWTQ